MTTTETPPDSTDALTLPELIAQQLTSMHIIDGRLVKLYAEAGRSHVSLEVSHPFPPKSHMFVVLNLSDPTGVGPDTGLVDAEIVDAKVEIGASA